MSSKWNTIMLRVHDPGPAEGAGTYVPSALRFRTCPGLPDAPEARAQRREK